jgi:hypothetical protein
MASKSSEIKTKIKTLLDALVTAGTLGEVVEDDFRESNLFDRDLSAFPAAILTSPSISGDYLTSNENMRTYTFEIVVLQKGENIASASEIEDLAEALMDKFDNDPTLGGKADGAVEPSATNPAPVTVRGKTLIVFSITLKAKASITLTF